MKDEWIKMGVVGVDSGQLMICDPCYLDSWESDDYQDMRKYRDTQTGKIYQYITDFDDFESILSEYDNKTPNMLIREKRWEGIPYEPVFNFGYNYISHRDKKYKQIPYQMGHAGLAVVFDSGLGDGSYEVWGRMREIPGWGERISEVLIKLVDDKRAEEVLEHFKKNFWSKEPK